MHSSEKLVGDIRKMAAEGKDINDLRKAKQKYITDVRQRTCTHTHIPNCTFSIVQVYQICSICLGTPPTTFDWEYKDKDDKYVCP